MIILHLVSATLYLRLKVWRALRTYVHLPQRQLPRWNVRFTAPVIWKVASTAQHGQVLSPIIGWIPVPVVNLQRMHPPLLTRKMRGAFTWRHALQPAFLAAPPVLLFESNSHLWPVIRVKPVFKPHRLLARGFSDFSTNCACIFLRFAFQVVAQAIALSKIME